MYSHLIFTGGGLSGITYIGVIRYLQERGLHKHIHEVAGSSIGAFFAALFAMNIMAGEMEDYFKDFFQQEENITLPLFHGLSSLLDTFGIDNGKRLIKPVRDLFCKKYDWKKDKITFRDFVKKTGINLVICATNIYKRCGVYFNVNDTPDICILDAIQASMTIPFIVQPMMIEGEMYVDGSLCDDTPVNGFEHEKINALLMISITSTRNIHSIPTNIIDYTSTIFQIMLSNSKMPSNIIRQKTNVFHNLILQDTPIPFINMEADENGIIYIRVSRDDIDNAVAFGYSRMYEYIKEKQRELEEATAKLLSE